MNVSSRAFHCALLQFSEIDSSGLDSGVAAALVCLSLEGSHNG
ncbi:MAG TPA: hypothetical protein PKE16_12585 [Hyphomicrobium sp.]|nr:hypothetical protein [Hyphomicrobium sp.]